MVSIIIPTLNHKDEISRLIPRLRRIGSVSEILVIDGGSTDDSIRVAKDFGVDVRLSSQEGRGSCLADGLLHAKGEFVIFWSPELFPEDDSAVQSLIDPLVADSADFVKGWIVGPEAVLSEFCVLPQLNVFFPEVMRFRQPLCRVVSARKNFMNKIKLPRDEGVDVGLLIDVVQLGVRVGEVQLNLHEKITLPSKKMRSAAKDVTRTIIERAAKYRRVQSHLVTDASDGEIIQGHEKTRLLSQFDLNKDIVLCSVDRLLIHGSYLEAVAHYSGIKKEYEVSIGSMLAKSIDHDLRIGKMFSGVPRYIFEKIARAIPIKPKIQETILILKRMGFQVGLFENFFGVGIEIIRSRVFADFILSYSMEFKKGLATGVITKNPIFKDGVDGLKQGLQELYKTEERACGSKIFFVGSSGCPHSLWFEGADTGIVVGKNDVSPLIPQSIQISSFAELPDCLVEYRPD